MEPHKTKNYQQVNESSRANQEEKGAWKTKRTVRLGVDFQRIEERPRTDLQHEVVRRIAVEKSPFEILAEQEQSSLVRNLIHYTKDLSARERICINLFLDNYSFKEIGVTLNIRHNSARIFVFRAIEKIKKAVPPEMYKKYF